MRNSQVNGVVEKYLSGLEAQSAFQAALQRSLAGYQPSVFVDRLQQDRECQKVRNMPTKHAPPHVTEGTLTYIVTAGDLSHAAGAG